MPPRSRPRRIRHFEILEEKLGVGGFAVVHRARDTRLGREVALKELLPEIVANPEARRDIVAEAKLIAGLSHPGIVTLHDIVRQRHGVVLVMELVVGETLRDRLRGGALAPAEVIRIGCEVADAVAHAHDRGIVHRDLKPSNLLVARDGRIKVTDFGLARAAPGVPLLDSTEQAPNDTAAGTPPYMCPEQVRGHAPDMRGDIFSLCIVLYEAATGRRPFRGATFFALANAILHAEPAWDADAAKALPPGLVAVLARGLQKEPDRRYPDMRSLGRDLARALQGTQRRRSRAALSIVGRRDEIDRLQAALSEAETPGGHGGTRIVSGEAGIGKSTLITEFLRLLAVEHRHASASGAFRAGRSGFAALAGPVVALLSATGGERAGRLRAEMEGDDPVRPFPALLDEALEVVAGLGPFVLVLEDVHQASADALAALRIAVAAMPATKGLLILTYRAEDERGAAGQSLRDFAVWARGERLAEAITLRRFESVETAELVQSLLPGSDPADPDLVRWIHAETEGNPLFVRHTLRLLQERGGLEADVPFLADDRSAPVPQEIRDVLRLRLTSLEPELVRLLEAAAVQGESFGSTALEAVLGWSRARVLDGLRALVHTHGLISPVGTDYRFAHAKIRELIEGEWLLPEIGRDLHSRTAVFLREHVPADVAGIARHMVDAGDEAEAVPYLVSAAGLAWKQAATVEARSLYATVSHILEAGATRAGHQHLQMLIRLGDMQKTSGQHDEARATFEKVVRLARDEDTRGEALHSLGWLRIPHGELDEAGRLFERALGCFRRSNNRRWQAASQDALGCALSIGGHMARALTVTRKGLALRRRIRFRWGEAMSLSNLGAIHFALGRYQRASASFVESRRIIRRHPVGIQTKKREALAIANHGFALLHLGQIDEARRLQNEALALRREISDRPNEAHSLLNLAEVHLITGFREAAREVLERAARMTLQGRDRAGHAEALRGLGRLHRSDGRPREAIGVLERALEEASLANDPEVEGLVAVELAVALVDGGFAERARECVGRGLRVSRKGAIERLRARALHAAGRVADARGERAAAIRHLRDAVATLRTRPEPETAWRVHRELSRLYGEGTRSHAAAAQHRRSATRIIRKVAAGIGDPRSRQTYLAQADRAAVLRGHMEPVSQVPTGSMVVGDHATGSLPGAAANVSRTR